LTVAAASIAACLTYFGGSDRFYVQTPWQVLLMIVSASVWVGMEVYSVYVGELTIKQELLPAKLYHTIMAVVVCYLYLSALPCAFLATAPPLYKGGIMVGFGGYLLLFITEGITWVKKIR
jgi:hypothetical protein